MEDTNYTAQTVNKTNFLKNGPIWKNKWFVIGISAGLILVIVITALIISNNSNKNSTANTNQATNSPTPSNKLDLNSTGTPSSTPSGSPKHSWEFDGENWKTTLSSIPSCETPLIPLSPVDTKKATAILYPGQYRGTDYKAHGGFRFDNNLNNNIEVKVPIDSEVLKASRYIENGEIQYLFEFLNSCGIGVRFDHLLTLSPAFQAIADTLPPAKTNDSRTTDFAPNQYEFKKGDLIATRIGFEKSKPINVAVDFGVYDYRQRNIASNDAQFTSTLISKASQAFYGICWLTELPTDDAVRVIQLPAGDQMSGKKSDYCK